MEMYTIQLASWREARRLGIPMVDITAKSGDETFAPEWDALRDFKMGLMSESEYERRYRDHMLTTFRLYRPEWENFLSRELVAVACYCGAGTFCHRHIFKDLVKTIHEKRKLPFVYGGEITKETTSRVIDRPVVPTRQSQFNFHSSF